LKLSYLISCEAGLPADAGSIAVFCLKVKLKREEIPGVLEDYI